jgi:hypothetical protein
MATQFPTFCEKEVDYILKIEQSVRFLNIAYNVLIIGQNFVENAYRMVIRERLSQR